MTTLTPQQLETAARKLCELRGIDPEGKFINENSYFQTNWSRSAREIQSQLQIQEAINFAIAVERSKTGAPTTFWGGLSESNT